MFKTIVTALAMMALAGASFAADPVTFDTPTCNPNYCTNYHTSDPGVAVSFANLTATSTYAGAPYKLTITINGVTYAGNGTRNGYAWGPAPVTAADGSQYYVSADLQSVRHCNGRYGCTTTYEVLSGTLN